MVTLTEQESEGYDAGFRAYGDEKPFNAGFPIPWQLGWLDAYEIDEPSETQIIVYAL